MRERFLKFKLNIFLSGIFIIVLAITGFGTGKKNVYSRGTSLEPPMYLPDGTEFLTWEVPLEFSRTYYVNNNHPEASDDNPGTKDSPFLTINMAARVLKPGERVVVASGVYRECVRPERSGNNPDKIISYETEPGARVIIKGSEKLNPDLWQNSQYWRQGWNRTFDAKVWMVSLPEELFVGYNPFGMVNQRLYQGSFNFEGDNTLPIYMLSRGLVFQDGRLLKQVATYFDLFAEDGDGTYWVEKNGLAVHVRAYDDVEPRNCEFEITTREQIFAPAKYYLGYIRVKGFIMEQCGDGFPVPQRAVLSTMRGHHWIIEDNEISWANALGMDIGNQDWNASEPGVSGHNIVRRNKVTDCGVCGICGIRPDGSLIEDNVVLRNNWHDVDRMHESAGIKLHTCLRVLLRRNIIMNNINTGGIWLDYGNINSRCCQNVVVGHSSSHGGIYVEASQKQNMVDNNFIWDMNNGNSVYTADSDRLIAAHNMVGKCTRTAVNLFLGWEDRWISGRSHTCRKHKVMNNIFIDNARIIEFDNPDNFSDHNLFSNLRRINGPFRIRRPEENLNLIAWREFRGFDIHSAEVEISAEFNPETLELTWNVTGNIPVCPKIDAINEDFFGKPRKGKEVLPGPFSRIPSKRETIKVDPRSRLAKFDWR